MPVNTDICIIGSGLAGCLLAASLTRSGCMVTILEAGPPLAPRQHLPGSGRGPTEGTWALESGHPAAIVYEDLSDIGYALRETVVKGVGGTTLAWLGTALRLQSDDFSMKSLYGVGADWPVDLEALLCYYRKAEIELSVAGVDDNPWEDREDFLYPQSAFDPHSEDHVFRDACVKMGIRVHSTPQARNSEASPVCVGSATCIPFCPSGAKYTALRHLRQALATGKCTLLENSVAYGIISGNTNTRVTTISQGRVKEVMARTVIVAANAIESCKILLMSGQNWKHFDLRGVGGALGHYFMDHPVIVSRGTYKGLGPPEGYQTMQSFEFYNHPRRASEAAFKLEFSRFPQFAWEKSQDAGLKITAIFDMIPRLENQIALSKNVRDNLGFPAVSVRLCLSDYEGRAIHKARGICESILGAAGARNITTSPPAFGIAPHPSGTCRMGTDPCNSVVDADLAVHGHPNVFVVGSSVFPTIGAANPSLTIAALSLRLADHILAQASG